MSNKNAILSGLAVLIVAAFFPVWYGFIAKKGEPPVIEKPTNATKCVEDVEYMRAYHMDMLNTWRDKVVREGQRWHESKNGKFEMSLTRGCMSCHEYKKSCYRCHSYVNVHPYCWDCHLSGKEE